MITLRVCIYTTQEKLHKHKGTFCLSVIVFPLRKKLICQYDFLFNLFGRKKKFKKVSFKQMGFVAVVLQDNKEVLPHERLLAMGHVVISEQREIKRKSSARTMMNGVGSHAHLSPSRPCLFMCFLPHKGMYKRHFSLIERMSLVHSINI